MNDAATASATALEPVTWTKEMRALVKKADTVVVRFDPILGLAPYERDKRVVTLHLNFKGRDVVKHEGINREETNKRVMLGRFSGRIANGYNDEIREVKSPHGIVEYVDYAHSPTNVYEPKKGSVIFTYAQTDHSLQTAFRSIPAGSSLHFDMLLDHGSSPAVAKHGIHVDILRLTVTTPGYVKSHIKKPPPLVFDLETSVGPHNTARFGWEGRY